MTLVDRHVAFLHALREAGMPVSISEGLDAAEAITMVDLGEREAVRAVYAATVVKRHAHRRVFDELFDLWFPAAVGDGVAAGAAGPSQPRRSRPIEITGARSAAAEAIPMREELAELLLDGDDAALAQLARQAVGQFGQVGGGMGRGSRSWSPDRVRSMLSARTLLAGLVRTALADAGRPEEADPLAEPMLRRTLTDRIARFEESIVAETRRRSAEDRGVERVAEIVVRPPLEQIDFLSATRRDLTDLRREIYPLAQRLAARMARDHRHGRRGQLDFRRTVRSSLAYGGVPMTTHHKPKRPHKPELVVLCDTSASVASFARFALLLVYALSAQFTKVRSFAFVNTVAEMTHHFAGATDLADAVAAMERDPSLPWLNSGTHYGRAFSLFAERHRDAVGPRTSLLVLGDARANHGDLGLPVFTELARQARHTYWLNPEPRRNWGTGDSEAFRYGEVVPMVECRNLVQLTEFVRTLA